MRNGWGYGKNYLSEGERLYNSSIKIDVSLCKYINSPMNHIETETLAALLAAK